MKIKSATLNIYLAGGLTVLAFTAVFCWPIRGDFPLNDDWMFASGVKTLVQHGRLSFVTAHLIEPNLIGQVIPAWGWCLLMGEFSWTNLRILTLLMSGLCLLILGFNAQKFDKTFWWIPVLLLLANPVFQNLSVTFMTDNYFLLSNMVALFLATHLLNIEEKSAGMDKEVRSTKNALLWLLFILAVCWSFSIRQMGSLWLPAMVFAMEINPLNWRKKEILLLVLFVLIYAGFEAAKHTPLLANIYASPNLVATWYEMGPLYVAKEMAEKLPKQVLNTGLFLTPVLPFWLYWLHKSGRLNIRLIIVVLMSSIPVAAGAFFGHKPFPFGNILGQWNIGPLLLHDAFYLNQNLPGPEWPLWVCLLLICWSWCAGVFILYGLCIEIIRAKQDETHFRLVGMMVLLLMASTVIVLRYFDRYQLVPVVLIALITPYENWIWVKSRWAFILSVSFFYLYSLAGTHDYLNWNAARSTLFKGYLEGGHKPKEIDAGLEWNGLYNYNDDFKNIEGKSYWWVSDDRYMITFGPVEGYDTIIQIPWSCWLYPLKSHAICLNKRIR